MKTRRHYLFVSIFTTSVMLNGSWSLQAYSSEQMSNVADSLIALENAYQEECIELSVIEKIQLARTPDRRKQLSITCSKERWATKAYSQADLKYNASASTDGVFRAELEKIYGSQLLTRQNQMSFDNTFFMQKESAYPDTMGSRESEKPFIETLTNHKTINP